MVIPHKEESPKLSVRQPVPCWSQHKTVQAEESVHGRTRWCRSVEFHGYSLYSMETVQESLHL